MTVPSVAQSFLRGQLAYMSDSGWKVILACSPGRGLDIVREREQIEVRELRTPRGISLLADVKSLLLWLRLLHRVKPAVLNVSTPKAGLIGALAGWVLRVPKRVYVVRGLRLESESGVRRTFLILMERLTIALATDVIAVSHSLRDELVTLKLMGRKTPLVLGHGSSNGVDAEGIQGQVDRMDRTTVRRNLGVLDDSAFLIAFIGRIRRDKGIPELIEAMSLPGLEEAILVTVGDTEEKDLQPLLEGLGDRWLRNDWLDDVTPVLYACDVLCLPTHREGFPNVVLEAGAAGRPVVTTTATGARDSVVHGSTGLLVPVGDADALSRALTRLADSPALRAELGENAKLRVREEYRSVDIWRALDATYRGVAMGDPAVEAGA